MKTKQLPLWQKDTEHILNVIKSKQPFGFTVDSNYRNHNLRQRLKNIANKTRNIVWVYNNNKFSKSYFINPYPNLCQDLTTLEYKKFCNLLSKKTQNNTLWTEEMFITLIQKSKSTEII